MTLKSESLQDIQRGDELLVWYGASYTLYMGLPVTSGHTTKPLAISGDVNVEPVTSVDVINEQSLKSKYQRPELKLIIILTTFKTIIYVK
ncbi:hypothetical protein DPMN_156749 [Dreissena polymorpha]|uniref:Uncharacterized protein n=1 Tax=Dreissena polymorpha TaxID=45954 RepID=A0A9D4FQE3_DREPO|nr:hypothetical protein DPMN_156749 [Dreissena polymorpha]